MSLIAQALAVSYPAVLNKQRGPTNQWKESAFLDHMEKSGYVEHVDFGPTIEASLDWRRNQAAGFQATELEPQSLAKTDVITAASYTIAELTAPMVWSKKDEATNTSETAKVKLVKKIAVNGIDSHDDILEEALFATTTNGFIGLQTLVPDSGQGSPGGIDASVEAWWRNPVRSYTGASDIEVGLTYTWNDVSKGSGSGLTPRTLISGSTPHTQFESTLQGLQRFDDQNGRAGFKVLQFKTADYIFSQYGGTRVYSLNPKSFGLKVSKEFFRQKDDAAPIQNANGYVSKIYSALQLITDNKSRCGLTKI